MKTYLILAKTWKFKFKMYQIEALNYGEAEQNVLKDKAIREIVQITTMS